MYGSQNAVKDVVSSVGHNDTKNSSDQRLESSQQGSTFAQNPTQGEGMSEDEIFLQVAQHFIRVSDWRSESQGSQ